MYAACVCVHKPRLPFGMLPCALAGQYVRAVWRVRVRAKISDQHVRVRVRVWVSERHCERLCVVSERAKRSSARTPCPTPRPHDLMTS